MNEKKKTSPIIKAAIIIGVILIPLMYSYFYLGAFWDPYARLEDVPVAVVNLDKGSEINGEMRNLGDEICDELAEDGSLGFVFTDKEDAEQGVLGDEYYASITIPEDFSEDVATVSGDTEKIHSSIIYTANQKKNYLAAQILENSMPTIKEKMNSKIDGEIIATLSDKLNSVPDEMGALQDGLGQLSDGAGQLKDGTAQLKSSVPELSSGMDALDKGAGQLSDGLGTLKSNSTALNSGAGSLAQGADTLKDGVKNYTAGVDQAGSGAKALQAGIGAYTQGVSQASAGADSLYNGIVTAEQGVAAMKSQVDSAAGAIPGDETLNTLSGGASNLSSGIANFSGGYSQAVEALRQYQQATGDQNLAAIVGGFDSLGQNLPALQGGADAVSGGVNQLTSGVQNLRSGVGALSAGLGQLDGAFGSTADPNTLIGGAYALSSGLDQVASNNDALNGGISQLSGGLDTLSANNDALNSGAGALKNGAGQLAEGVDKYTEGVSAASDGAAALKAGTSRADAGAGELASGAAALDNGAGQLEAGIGTAKDGVNTAVSDAKSELKALNGLSEYGEEPVKTETEYVQPVANYGSAFAPYFMGLSLWVGCLMIYFGIYLDYERRIKLLSKDSDKIVLRTGAFALISAAQAILLAVVIKDVLHITVNNPAMLFGACILVSITFMTIVQFCLINLGDAGKFFAMLLLILQLTSCAGTFPIETQSGFFRAINKVLPMTYSTQLFKEAISGTAGANAGHSALILAGFAAGFLVLTLVLSHNALKKDLGRINHEAVNKLHEMKAGA